MLLWYLKTIRIKLSGAELHNMEKLKLANPLKYFSINQGFGENGTPYYAQLGLKGHNGLDLFALDGTPVYAAHDGTVTFSGDDGSAGIGIVITTDQDYDYNGKPTRFKSIYWHLKKGSLKVVASQKVKTGDMIAEADNTGMSTGSHLHFGLKPVLQGETAWSWENVEQNNGYKGAIDPLPYLPSKRYFDTKLKRGDDSQQVAKVQAFLIRTKRLPPQQELGHYGPLTQEAIYKLQLEHCNLTWYEKNIMRGNTIGEKTLKVLNELHELEEVAK